MIRKPSSLLDAPAKRAIAGVAVAAMLLTGCAVPGGAGRAGTTTTATDLETESGAAGDARAVAVSLFEPLGLVLPADARDITVDRSPLEPFENASLTSFTAGSAEVTAACESAGAMVAPDARIVAQDAKVLRGVHVTEGSTLCSKDSDYGRGPAFRAVIPPSKTGTVYVAVYQLPAGR